MSHKGQLPRSLKVTKTPKQGVKKKKKCYFSLWAFNQIQKYIKLSAAHEYLQQTSSQVCTALLCFLSTRLYIPAATSGSHTQGLQGALKDMHASMHICTHHYTHIDMYAHTRVHRLYKEGGGGGIKKH